MSHPDRRRVGEESSHVCRLCLRTLYTLSRKAPQSADGLMRDRNPPRGDFQQSPSNPSDIDVRCKFKPLLIVDVNPQGGRHWPPVQRTRWTPVFPGESKVRRALPMMSRSMLAHETCTGRLQYDHLAVTLDR